MTPPDFLHGSHLRTFTTIFQHPLSHNLGWHDVYALFRQLGQVYEQPNGSLKVTRNGHQMVLHPARTKDVSASDEIMTLRHFIVRSESANADAEPKESEAHWLLVIDHHEARIFHPAIHGSLTLQILPPEPDSYFRHATHSLEFSRGQEKPDPNSYFEPVAAALKGAGSILIFGTGTGTSSEMDQFIAWMKRRHPDLAHRIIDTLVVDAHHLTKNQLLEKAREFYAAHPASLT